MNTPTPKARDLLACAHCGGEAGPVEGFSLSGRPTVTIFCDGCRASAATEYTYGKAAERWNTRAAPSLPSLDREAVARILAEDTPLLAKADAILALGGEGEGDIIAAFREQTGLVELLCDIIDCNDEDVGHGTGYSTDDVLKLLGPANMRAVAALTAIGQGPDRGALPPPPAAQVGIAAHMPSRDTLRRQIADDPDIETDAGSPAAQGDV